MGSSLSTGLKDLLSRQKVLRGKVRKRCLKRRQMKIYMDINTRLLLAIMASGKEPIDSLENVLVADWLLREFPDLSRHALHEIHCLTAAGIVKVCAGETYI